MAYLDRAFLLLETRGWVNAIGEYGVMGMDNTGFLVDRLSLERRGLTIDLPGVGTLVCAVSTKGASTEDQRKKLAKSHAQKLIETFQTALENY